MKSGERYSTLPPSRLTRVGWAEMEKSVRSFVRSLARCGVGALRRRGNLERWPTERRPRPHVRPSVTPNMQNPAGISSRGMYEDSPLPPSRLSGRPHHLVPLRRPGLLLQRQQIVRGSDTTENAEKINLLRLEYKMSSLDDHLVRLGGEHRASLSVGQVFHVYTVLVTRSQFSHEKIDMGRREGI